MYVDLFSLFISLSLCGVYTFSRRAPPHEVPTVHPDGFPSDDKSGDGRSFPSPVSTSCQQNVPYHSSLPSPPAPHLELLQSSSPPTAASSTVQGLTALPEREDQPVAIGTCQEVTETTGDGGIFSGEAWGDRPFDTKMQRGTASSSGKAMTTTQGLSLRNRLSRNLSLSRSKPSDPFAEEDQDKKKTRREGETGGRFFPRRGFSSTTSHRRPAFPEDKKNLSLPSKRRSSWQLFTSTTPRDETDHTRSSSQRGGGGRRRSQRRFFSSLPRRRQDDELDGSGPGRQHFFERLRRRRGRRAGSFGGDFTVGSSTLDNEDGYLSSRFPSQPHDPQHFVTYPPPPSADSSSVSPSHQEKIKEGREKGSGSSFSKGDAAKPPFPERQVTEETAVSEGPFGAGVREGKKKNGSSLGNSLRLPEPEDDKRQTSRRFSSRGRNFFSRFSSRRSDSRRKADEKRRDGFRSKSFSPIRRKGGEEDQDEEKEGKRGGDGRGGEEKKGQEERRRREGGGVAGRLRMIATRRRRSFGGKGRREEKDFSDNGSTALGDGDLDWTVPHWEDEEAKGKDDSQGRAQDLNNKEKEASQDSVSMPRRNEGDGEPSRSSSSGRGHGESDRQNNRNRDRTSGTRDRNSISATRQGGEDQRDVGISPPFFLDEAGTEERKDPFNTGKNGKIFLGG